MAVDPFWPRLGSHQSCPRIQRKSAPSPWDDTLGTHAKAVTRSLASAWGTLNGRFSFSPA